MTDVFRKFVNNQICGCYDAHVQNARRQLIGIVTARAGEGSGVFRVPKLHICGLI